MPLIQRVLKSKPIRIAACCVAALSILVACIWLLRISIVDYAIRSFAESQQAIQSLDFEISKLDLDSITFRNLTLRTRQGTLSADSLAISYSLRELWKSNSVENIELKKAIIKVDTRTFQSSDDASPIELPKAKSELLALLDISVLAPLPFQRIQISDSQIDLAQEQFVIPFSANLESSTHNRYPFSLKLGDSTLSLAADGLLSTEDKTQFQIQFNAAHPLQSLSKFVPDWKSMLPEGASLDLKSVHGTLALNAESPLQITIESTYPVFVYDELLISLSKLNLQSYFDSTDQISWHATLLPEEVHYDTFTINPSSPINLEGTITNLKTASLLSLASIPWSYDSDYLTGNTQLALEFAPDSESVPFTGTLIQKNLNVAGFSLQDFSASFESDFETYELRIPDLYRTSTNTPLTLASAATLILPKDALLPTTLHWSSELNPNALPELADVITTDSFNFNLGVALSDSETTTDLKLNSTGKQTLAILPDTLSASGALTLALTLVENETAESYELSANTTFSGGNLKNGTFHADGIEATQDTRIVNLPTSFLDAEFETLADTFSALLPHVNATLDWQANEISTDDAKAQWLGGSLSLSPFEDAYRFQSEAVAGAVAFDSLRFEQLYLDSVSTGNLSLLDGQVSASTLFEGVPIQAKLTHQLASPLSELYLSGEYEINPATFVGSDLLGRVVPELAGSTVTATVAANGRFQANRSKFNSSLNATLLDTSFRYPPSKISAAGIALDLRLESLSPLTSTPENGHLSIAELEAGDLTAANLNSSFRFKDDSSLSVTDTHLEILGGKALLPPIEIPLDGSDFKGRLAFEKIDLAQLSDYVDIFRGRMTGRISGELPFSLHDGSFALERGELQLPSGETATLSYPAKGLLTGNPEELPIEKPTFSDRLLKFLKIEPEAMAEEAMSNVTIDAFRAELFPEDAPTTPLRIRLSGTAHSPQASIPIVIQTNLHGTLSELYNFLIRLNSI